MKIKRKMVNAIGSLGLMVMGAFFLSITYGITTLDVQLMKIAMYLFLFAAALAILGGFLVGWRNTIQMMRLRRKDESKSR